MVNTQDHYRKRARNTQVSAKASEEARPTHAGTLPFPAGDRWGATSSLGTLVGVTMASFSNLFLTDDGEGPLEPEASLAADLALLLEEDCLRLDVVR